MNFEGEAWAKVSQWAPGCAQSKFSVWVQRKAAALWERDKKKLIAQECAVPETTDNEKRAEYRQAIYKAIVEMKENKCPYTGKVLRWNLIGEWKNDNAKKRAKHIRRSLKICRQWITRMPNQCQILLFAPGWQTMPKMI